MRRILKIFFYIICLISLKVCVYHLLKLYHIDSRIPVVYFHHLVRYEDYPIATYTHLIAGLLFIIIIFFQFSPKSRKYSLMIHRNLGVAYLAISFMLISSGLYIGFTFPFAGIPEMYTMVVLSLLFTLFIIKALLAIKERNKQSHRVWMIRANVLALLIGTQRVLVPLMTALKFGSD